MTKYKLFINLCLLFCIFAGSVCASENLARRVILVGWDGAQGAHVQESLGRHALPQLEALIKEGGMVPILVEGRTETKPGFARILTGQPSVVNLIESNGSKTAIPRGFTMFEVLEDHFKRDKIVTAALTTKNYQFGYVTAREPYYHARKVMDVFEKGLGDDRLTADAAIAFLNGHQGERFFLFVALAAADVQGHRHGENSKEYDAALEAYDALTGQIVAQLKALGIFETTAIYVTADHGFDEGRQGHASAPHVFLVSNDRQGLSSGLQTDIAPLILERFGVKSDKFLPVANERSSGL